LYNRQKKKEAKKSIRKEMRDLTWKLKLPSRHEREGKPTGAKKQIKNFTLLGAQLNTNGGGGGGGLQEAERINLP
jgi:hypothetical protein